ncbi:MAG: hypothetical protein KAR06_00280 [Deltaproteobacteria bacterium]|nr:hypothetical protein [Deltaproteobacteria bacterium]
MDKKINVRITKDGKVEVDSTVFEDCRDVANHFAKILGKVEKFEVKEEDVAEETLNIKSE